MKIRNCQFGVYIFLVILYLSKNIYRRRTAEDPEMLHDRTSSSGSGSRGTGCSQDSPGLTHMVYFSANGERYQMYDCNVEMHEDWNKTSRVVDIIYPSGPAAGVRIMYELETYENNLGGETVCVVKSTLVLLLCNLGYCPIHP